MNWVAESFDTANMHKFNGNYDMDDPTRLTAPVAGVYQVSANIEWTSDTTGSRFLGLDVNGVPWCDWCYWAAARAPASDKLEQDVSALIPLAQGDYVEAVVMQTSGGDIHASVPPQRRETLGALGRAQFVAKTVSERSLPRASGEVPEQELGATAFGGDPSGRFTKQGRGSRSKASSSTSQRHSTQKQRDPPRTVYGAAFRNGPSPDAGSRTVVPAVRP